MEYEQTTHPTKRRKNGKKASCSWHVKIWIEAFGEIPDNHIIHHINGDKKDNRIENLECVNRSAHANAHVKLKVHSHPINIKS
jgi:hypothetical protein